jgi:hypothetical protein
MTSLKPLLLPACATLVFCAPLFAGDDGPAPASAEQSAQLPALSAAQERAVGIVIAAAPAAKPPQRIDAYGRVLDPSQLVADAGQLDSSRAAAAAAAAEAARLQGLYRGGAGASLKVLQAAQAAQAEAQARVREAKTEFLLHWGPLARLAHAQRSVLIERLAAGGQLLLRADLPGRHSLGAIPQQALVEVDGVQVPARVLGPLPQAAAPLQSVGLLLQIAHPPPGLGPGAQLPVVLEGSDREGRVVPDGALLYGEQGVYVYRVLPGKTQDGDTRFAPLPVKLLQPIGEGWLVTGLTGDDRIVVHGAGVLWSLQGLGNVSDEDTD